MIGREFSFHPKPDNGSPVAPTVEGTPKLLWCVFRGELRPVAGAARKGDE